MPERPVLHDSLQVYNVFRGAAEVLGIEVEAQPSAIVASGPCEEFSKAFDYVNELYDEGTKVDLTDRDIRVIEAIAICDGPGVKLVIESFPNGENFND
jgi:hypothetical protein